MNSKFITYNDVYEKSISILKDLEQNLNDPNGIILTHDHDHLTIDYTTTMNPNLLLANNSLIKNIIVSFCDHLEATFGQSSKSFITSTKSLFEIIMYRISLGEHPSKISQKLDDEFLSIKTNIKRTHITSKQAFSALEKTLVNQRDIKNLLIESIKLAGLSGKINIELSHSNTQDVIELTNGYVFYLENVLNLNAIDPWIAYNPRFLIIDGIIENISEIDNLLQESHSKKEPIVIFSRGFNEEVIKTITVNRVRKTVNAHLMKVPYDIIGANILKDLGVIAKSDVISSQKGQLISTIKFSQIKKVNKVFILGNKLIVTNDSNNESILLAKELSKLRDACNIPEMKDSYTQRIKTLFGTCVDIKIANVYKTDTKRKLSSLDNGLRTFRSLIANGIIDDLTSTNIDLLKSPCQIIINELKNNLNLIPTGTFIGILQQMISLTKTLCLSSGAIILNRDV